MKNRKFLRRLRGLVAVFFFLFPFQRLKKKSKSIIIDETPLLKEIRNEFCYWTYKDFLSAS